MKQKTGVRKFMHELEKTQVAALRINSCEVHAHLFDDASKLSLTTPVFLGSYIPPSVKQWITKKPPFESPHFKTSLKLDDEKGKISLYYLGKLDASPTPGKLAVLLEEFASLANKWRIFLDQHGQNDLIYIRVK